jgi:hypothetical protein
MSATQKALRLAAKGLLFVSESDAPLVAVHLGDSEFDTLHKTDSLTVAAFFAPMTTPQPWHDETERRDVERFQLLSEKLAALDGALAYRMTNESEIEVYVLGKDPAGGYTGVRTRLTET